MITKNLLRMGFLGLFCALGTFAWADDGSITLPNSDVVSCTFSTSKTDPDTEYFTFYTDNISSNTSYGSVTIDGTEYDHYIKVSGTDDIITFTTLSENTALTLVVGPNDDMTGDKYISINDDALYVDKQVLTYNCETVGTYTIKKGASGEYHIFYIGLDKEIAKVSDSEDQGDDQGDDQTEGGDGSITLPNSDVVSCTFSESKTDPDTEYFTFYTDNISSNASYGSVTIDGTEYDHYIKVSGTDDIITFTTLSENTALTLVVGPNDDMTGDKYISINDDALYVTSQVLTYTCATVGTYTIKKGASGEYHIFYIGLDKAIATVSDTNGINGVTLQTTGNNIYYNLAGQRVSSPTKGVYILNGKKILVK